GQNRERQSLERKITQQAKEMLAGENLSQLSAIVLAHEEWHPGVIGIVASRLCETFGRPTLLIASRADPAPGSGRSILGYPLHEALQACDDELCSHGGHASAAGFKVALDRIDARRKRVRAHAPAHFSAGRPSPSPPPPPRGPAPHPPVPL